MRQRNIIYRWSPEFNNSLIEIFYNIMTVQELLFSFTDNDAINHSFNYLTNTEKSNIIIKTVIQNVLTFFSLKFSPFWVIMLMALFWVKRLQKVISVPISHLKMWDFRMDDLFPFFCWKRCDTDSFFLFTWVSTAIRILYTFSNTLYNFIFLHLPPALLYIQICYIWCP